MKHRFAFLAVTILAICPAAAEMQIPALDVAVLSDVSGSVVPEDAAAKAEAKKKNQEARRIITDLVTGRTIDWSQLEWDVDTTGVDAEIIKLFGHSLGSSQGTVAPSRLTAPGHSVLIMPIGKLITVVNGSVLKQITDPNDFSSIISHNYPEAKQSPDGSTCYWYAMAMAADKLSRISSDGYYLFVFSDEQDDPDYLPPTQRHSSRTDYPTYQKRYEALYPASTIQSTVDEYFPKPKAPREHADTPPKNFPMTLVAKFYPRVARSKDQDPVRLSWYVMGTKFPRQAPAVTEVTPAPVPSPKLVDAPVFRPVIELLGGLRSGQTKTYSDQYPVIAWQLPFGEANALDSDDFVVVWLNSEDDQTATPHLVSHLTADSIPDTVEGEPAAVPSRAPFHGASRAWLKLPPGKHFIQVRSTYADGNEGPAYRSKAIEIDVEPRDNSWLLKLSIGSLALALAVFVWTWLKLRTSDSASAAG